MSVIDFTVSHFILPYCMIMFIFRLYEMYLNRQYRKDSLIKMQYAKEQNKNNVFKAANLYLGSPYNFKTVKTKENKE